MRASLLTFMLACSATVAYAAGGFDSPEPHGVDRYTPNVYDAQGKFVGPLASASGVSGVFLTVNGALTFVPIIHSAKNFALGRLEAERSASQYQWSDAESEAFASADCAGNPVITQTGETEDNSVGRPSMLIRNGTDVTLYVAADTYSSLNIVNSARDLLQGTPGSCVGESPANFIDPAWPVESVYPITQHYPEPLRVGFGER
ncbi:hypothetical protein [Paraburkholderia sp. DHOC27]|uniref:hypothetical protein n=1 Tax=Paraburkholderia sp. DHOC27 TaxID=2303330 RepID=UPI000E3CCD2E|nr:hypothetical protein [Paraburkholderia sp. DHOC27]RFU48867.1 hypothetical protein D0B32_03270 [Paraburkholderia sp. DHOC27]